MKKLVASMLAALMVVSGITAQNYFDISSFDDLPIMTESSASMSETEIEVLVRSIIRTELEAQSEKEDANNAKMEAEINSRVESEMKKYRQASDEYLDFLTKEMEKKSEDEILEIKTNYALQLAEEKIKLKNEYEEKLANQKTMSDLALLEALGEAESQRQAELSKLQQDMELKQEQKDKPFEYAELFVGNTNPDDKSNVSVSNKNYSYKGKNYKGLLYKGNTGKPKADWNSWYSVNLGGSVFTESSIYRDLKNANTLKFKVVGDGNWYKVVLYRHEENSYSSYMYQFKTEKGVVQEISAHRSKFVSFDTEGMLNMSDMNGFNIDFEYGMEGKARPDSNKNFEATFFDFEFVNDSVAEQTLFDKIANPFVYADNFATNKNGNDDCSLYLLDTKYTFEGKEYKAINFVGNTGSADKNMDHWYGITFAKWNRQVTDEMINNFLRKGKTLKFKVLGDGNTYKISFGYYINNEYTPFSYQFTTKKGKVTEVKIPVKNFKHWTNIKFDQSKVDELHIEYEWNKPGVEWKRAPKTNTNFNITIFDFSIF